MIYIWVWEDRDGRRKEGMIIYRSSRGISPEGGIILRVETGKDTRIAVFKHALKEPYGGNHVDGDERSGVEIRKGRPIEE